MSNYQTYGEKIMKNVKEILLNYKNLHGMTNIQMALLCDMSLSEYSKIMNHKKHSKYGCTADTLCKIKHNLNIDANDFFNIELDI